MGHSTASMTERFREERAFFAGFRRALLLKSDKSLFDVLWDEIEVYIPPAEKSDHPLLIATILMAMVLEQRRLLIGLQTRLDKLEQEAGTEHQKGQAGMRQLQSELRSLDEDLDARLQKLRLEIKELLYPADGIS
jgi:hypothetical protein